MASGGALAPEPTARRRDQTRVSTDRDQTREGSDQTSDQRGIRADRDQIREGSDHSLYGFASCRLPFFFSSLFLLLSFSSPLIFLSSLFPPIFLSLDVLHQKFDGTTFEVRYRTRRCPISKKVENGEKRGKGGLAIIRADSGLTPVARGGSGAKAPRLAARAYWQVVDGLLLRLLSPYVLVSHRLPLNEHTRWSKIIMLYHWFLSMDSFCCCEPYFTTHETVRGQPKCDFSILGRLSLLMLMQKGREKLEQKR